MIKVINNNIIDIIRLLRPEQWIKNVFVFTGLLFGKQYLIPSLAVKVVLTALSFCFISSSIYIVNDIFDYESDLNHPKKKKRPLPSKKVSFPVAWGLSMILGILGLSLGFSISLNVGIILILYLFINALYSIYLKHIEVIDVFCLSSGFMLRILAGTIGVGIPPSNWLLLCGMMITLFLGFSKRFAEMNLNGSNQSNHRPVLKVYRLEYLSNMITICATGTIITYSLYTMSPQTIQLHDTQGLIYTVPFVTYVLFRYMYLLNSQDFGENPVKDLVQDPSIILSITAWGILCSYIIYFSH